MLTRAKRVHARRLSALALAALVLTMMFGVGPANSVTGGAATPNTNLENGELTRLTWTPPAAGVELWISQCNGKPANDPTWNVSLDCGAGFLTPPAAAALGSTGTDCPTPGEYCAPGTGPANPDFRVFSGFDFAETGWECGPGTTATEPGDVRYSTCQIRITEGSQANLDTDTFIPLTWTADPEPEPVVPEAPFAILLPLGAVAVAGGAYLVLRRRPSIAA